MLTPKLVRTATLVYGIAFTFFAIAGFIPGMTHMHGGEDRLIVEGPGHGDLLGLFHVNLLHNLTHLAFGVWGLVAYSRGYASSRIYGRGVAVIYGVLAIAGLVPGLNSMFGLVPLEGHDVWLHVVLAIGGAIFGFAPVEDDRGAAGTASMVGVR